MQNWIAINDWKSCCSLPFMCVVLITIQRDWVFWTFPQTSAWPVQFHRQNWLQLCWLLRHAKSPDTKHRWCGSDAECAVRECEAILSTFSASLQIFCPHFLHSLLISFQFRNRNFSMRDYSLFYFDFGSIANFCCLVACGRKRKLGTRANKSHNMKIIHAT